jgi:lipopolysaccharide/colanic/teichoic acid biosynthesis glycosyltransferase
MLGRSVGRNVGKWYSGFDASTRRLMDLRSSSLPHHDRWSAWLSHGRFEPIGFYAKRTLDLVGSSALIILLSPILLVVAIAIKVDSPGPILFVQVRAGARRRGPKGQKAWEHRTFRMYKFRSMFTDSDEAVHQQYIERFLNGGAANGNGARTKFKLVDDPRITRVGRFIRRSSIDELPQLFNVLKGDMSLVGPRPVPLYEIDGYAPHHLERLMALPGITGMWQVYGRGRVTFDEMVDLDISYVREHSFLLDLKLLILTIPAVIRGAGAE